MRKVIPLLLVSILLIGIIIQSIASIPISLEQPQTSLAQKAKALLTVAKNLVMQVEYIFNNTKYAVKYLTNVQYNLTKIKELLKKAETLYNAGKYNETIILVRKIMNQTRLIYVQICTSKPVYRYVEKEVKLARQNGTKERIRLMAKLLERLCERTNATNVVKLLKRLRERVKAGNLTGVNEEVNQIMKQLRHKIEEKLHEKLMKKIELMLKHEEEILNKSMLKGSKYLAKGIDIGIARINETIKKLESVVEFLSETNASPVAISSIEMTISHLKTVIEHLKEVKERIHEIVKEKKGIKLPPPIFKQPGREAEEMKKCLMNKVMEIEKMLQSVTVPPEYMEELKELKTLFEKLKQKVIQVQNKTVNTRTLMNLMKELVGLKIKLMKLMKYRKMPHMRLGLITGMYYPHRVRGGQEFSVRIAVNNPTNKTMQVVIKAVETMNGTLLKTMNVTVEPYTTKIITLTLIAPNATKTFTIRIIVVCYLNEKEVFKKTVVIVVTTKVPKMPRISGVGHARGQGIPQGQQG